MPMTNPASAPLSASALFAPGETGGIISAKDWSQTDLGPIEGWPQSLKTALSILLGSKQPMFVWWKTNHGLTIFYNDAYIPIAGHKHPKQIGADCWSAEGWAEMRPYLQSLVDQVFNERTATWNENLLLPLYREQSFLEEGYFSFSYSPVIGESGEVAGMFCATSETTKQVIGERRLLLLHNLGLGAVLTRSSEVVRHVAEQLTSDPRDIPFALLYLVNPGGESASLAGASVLPERTAASPERIDLAQSGDTPIWPLAVVMATRSMTVVDGIGRHLPADFPTEGWSEAPDRAVVLPLESPGQERPIGFLVLGLSPRLHLNQEYQSFLDMVAGHVATNLTNARTVEAERDRMRQLAELDQAKTSFFTNVSHEFRTPLTLMLGPLEELRRSVESPQLRELATSAERNAARLLKLVNTLLDFARIEGGRAEAHFESVDLGAATADLASAFRSACERAGLSLTVDVEPDLPPVHVDRDQWEKIVLNLISNAFKFTFEGGISVGLRSSPDRQHVRLTVRDTGVGIPLGEQGKLFGRFQRIEGIQGRSIEGSGIGLALVAELVKLHGGQIEVQSTEGNGTAFTVQIPFGSAHLPQERIHRANSGGRWESEQSSPFVGEALQWLANTEGETPQGRSAGATGDESLAPTAVAGAPRILIADDNADLRIYLKRLLEARSLVQTAVNGQIALEMALADPPDLILADVMMPLLDGFQLIKRLRADPRTRTLPIILLSARAGEEARIEGLAAGADDYLVKPFSSRELIARVSAHLSTAHLRREAEKAVRASEAQFRALITATSDAVYRMSPDWTQMRETDGRNFIPDTLESSGNWLEKYVPADEQAAVTTAIDRAITTRSVFELEHRVLLKDGGIGWTFSRAIPLFEGDEIVEWLGVASDATRRKEAETALLEADRRKDEFLAMLAHELRNPLAPIRNALHLLRLPGATGHTQRLHEMIDRQVTHMVRLVDDLTEASRISRGKLELERNTISLGDVLRHAVETCEPLLERAQHHFSMVLPPEPMWVHGDPIRLAQVFSNLLNNAAKYTDDKGRIEVSVQHDGGWAQVTVSDNGIGIEADQLPQLFQLFAQLDRGHTRSQGGLGIGLSLAQRLIHMHGGTIDASSGGPGQGSTFTVRIPLVPAQVPTESTTDPLAANDLRAYRILVADDNQDAAESLGMLLESLGAKVHIAHDGIAALQAVRSWTPAIAFIDLGMPGMDGYEVARRLRADARFDRTTLIALTGWGQEEDRKRTAAEGFDRHLVKPIDISFLQTLIASMSQ